MNRILVIEDDPAILQGIKITLEEENYSVITASDGEKGYLAARTEKPDLILLDLMLPGRTGLEICRCLRSEGNNTPVLMLTSKKEEIDKLIGFETGADDYVTKPFSLRELIARVRSLLRRSKNSGAAVSEFSFNNIFVDIKKHEVYKKKKPVTLSETEFKVLVHLINHEGEVISRDQLLDEVWGYDTYPTTRTVDNYILSLRKKLEDNPSEPKNIITVPKGGYRFVR